MVDTIVIKLPKLLNENFYNYCLENCNNSVNGFILNSASGVVEKSRTWIFKEISKDYGDYQIITGEYHSPSYNYHARYQIKEDYIKLEFSLPKFLFGSNVFELVHPNTLNFNPFQVFTKGLQTFLDTFPQDIIVRLNQIIISRIDFCFNQIFDSFKDSEIFLNHLKIKSKTSQFDFNLNNQPTKKTTQKNYSSGVVYISSKSYFKIYHKGVEFRKHDFKHCLEHPYFNFLNEFSQRIIRYESQKKSSNWSYLYLTKFSKYKTFYPIYLKSKGRQKSEYKRLFESRIQFSLDNNMTYYITQKQNNTIKTIKNNFFDEFKNIYVLTPEYFNFMYNNFHSYIKQKFTLNQRSVSTLKNELIENNKNRTQNLKILMFIKTYGSLENALNKNAISRRSFYRYKSILDEKKLSTTNVTININQDFSYHTYYKTLLNHNIFYYDLNNKFTLSF